MGIWCISETLRVYGKFFNLSGIVEKTDVKNLFIQFQHVISQQGPRASNTHESWIGVEYSKAETFYEGVRVGIVLLRFSYLLLRISKDYINLILIGILSLHGDECHKTLL